MRRQLRSIQPLVLDVDGVLTDGGLWFDGEGHVSKRFDVRDGLGIACYNKRGFRLPFSVVARRWKRFEPGNWESATALGESKTSRPPCRPYKTNWGLAPSKLPLWAMTSTIWQSDRRLVFY